MRVGGDAGQLIEVIVQALGMGPQAQHGQVAVEIHGHVQHFLEDVVIKRIGHQAVVKQPSGMRVRREGRGP